MTIPEGFIEWTLIFGGSAVPQGAQVAFGFQLPDSGDAQDWHDDLIATWDAHMSDRLTDKVSVVLGIIKVGPDEDGPRTEHAAAAPGTQVAESLPPNVALLGLKNTASGGRRGRGRFYLPGYAETGVDGAGQVSGAGHLANNDAVTEMYDEWTNPLLGNGPYIPVLFHSPPTEWQLVNGQPRRVPTGDPAPEPTVITSLSMSQTMATQRRRLR